MYKVYVIRSKVKNWNYVWITNCLERRLEQHNKWTSKSTKCYKPYTLIIEEEYKDAQEARQREKYLKSGIWKDYIIKIITSLPSEGVFDSSCGW